jgi:hypothetical protein
VNKTSQWELILDDLWWGPRAAADEDRVKHTHLEWCIKVVASSSSHGSELRRLWMNGSERKSQ